MEFNFTVAYSFWTNGFDDTWKWHKMIFNTQRVAVVLISYVEIVWHLWTIKSVRCEFVDTVENSIFMMLGFSHSITLSLARCVCCFHFKMHNTLQYPLFLQWVSFYDAPRVWLRLGVFVCVCALFSKCINCHGFAPSSAQIIAQTKCTNILMHRFRTIVNQQNVENQRKIPKTIE